MIVRRARGDHVRRHHDVAPHPPPPPAGHGRRLQTAHAPTPTPHGRAGLHQPHRQQRVPAQLEEVVVHADALQAQDLGERRAQDLLRARGRRPTRTAPQHLRGGQRPRSSFPFTVSGSASSTTTADGTMYSGSRSATTRAARPHSKPPCRSAGTTYATRRLSPGRSSRATTAACADPRVRGQHGLHLTRLDPEPTDLHLLVRTPQDTPTARPRSSAPHPPCGTSAHPPPERARDEPLRRQTRTPQIAPRQTCTPARYSSPPTPTGTGERELSSTYTWVFAIGPPIHRDVLTSRAPPGGDVDRRLRRPVEVVQLHTRPNTRRTGPLDRGQRLARADHPPQTRALGRSRIPQERLSIDGTKCSVDTPSSRITDATYAGPRDHRDGPPPARTLSNGQKNSHTDTSNPNGVFCNTRSPAPAHTGPASTRAGSQCPRATPPHPSGGPSTPT